MQDDLITTCLEHFRPMLTKMAWTYNIPVDDVLQEASLIILQALPKMPIHVENPQAYLRVVVRRQIYNYAHSLTPPQNVISLDRPLYEDSKQTLADLLPTPPVDLSAKREEKRRTALYKALHVLPRAEQECLRRRYGLQGFRVRSRQSDNPSRAGHVILRSALRQLRRNRELAAILTIEL